jgi:hypothetical protein
MIIIDVLYITHVVVTFPRILLNAFANGRVHPGCINLMVFEQCQKVTDTPNPYGEILGSINQLDVGIRPILIGFLPRFIKDTRSSIQHRVHADLIKCIETHMLMVPAENVKYLNAKFSPRMNNARILTVDPKNCLDGNFYMKMRAIQRPIDDFAALFTNVEGKETSEDFQYLMDSVTEWRYITTELGMYAAVTHGKRIVNWLGNNCESLCRDSIHALMYKKRIDNIKKLLGEFL